LARWLSMCLLTSNVTRTFTDVTIYHVIHKVKVKK